MYNHPVLRILLGIMVYLNTGNGKMQKRNMILMMVLVMKVSKRIILIVHPELKLLPVRSMT